MAHILYLTDTLGIHDRRFCAALAHRGHRVSKFAYRGSGTWWDGVNVVDGKLLGDISADLVQVGPLTLLEEVADLATTHSVVATCWGSDAYMLLSATALRVLRGARAVICDCQCIVERLVQMGVPRDCITSFAWGIDLGTFHPPSRNRIPGRRVFVSTRSLEPLYEHAFVVRAFSEVASVMPEAELRLYGTGSLRKDIRDLARELCLPGTVHIRNPVSESELAIILRSATAWINAARTDGTSVSLLQAMASGAGIISTDVECTREALGDVNAWLFESGDRSSLRQALLEARRMDSQETAVAWERLVEMGDWSKNAEIYVQAVESACDR